MSAVPHTDQNGPPPSPSRLDATARQNRALDRALIVHAILLSTCRRTTHVSCHIDDVSLAPSALHLSTCGGHIGNGLGSHPASPSCSPCRQGAGQYGVISKRTCTREFWAPMRLWRMHVAVGGACIRSLRHSHAKEYVLH